MIEEVTRRLFQTIDSSSACRLYQVVEGHVPFQHTHQLDPVHLSSSYPNSEVINRSVYKSGGVVHLASRKFHLGGNDEEQTHSVPVHNWSVRLEIVNAFDLSMTSCTKACF